MTGSFQSAGQIHGLVELPLRHGAVAEVADDHLVPALVLDGEAHPGRQGQMRAHDGVPAQEVDGLVEEVHRAALALGQPVAAPEQLGHGPPRDRSPWPGSARARGRRPPRSRRGAGPRSRPPPPLPPRCTGGESRRSCPSRRPRPPSPRSGGSASSRQSRCRASSPSIASDGVIAGRSARASCRVSAMPSSWPSSTSA